MKELREKLNAEIAREFEELKSMPIKDECRSKLIDDISKLYRLELEEQNALHRMVQDDRQYISEEADKAERFRIQKAGQNKDFADKVIGHICNVGGVVINVGAFGVLAYAVMRFEETGAITSTAYKLLTKTLPIVKRI